MCALKKAGRDIGDAHLWGFFVSVNQKRIRNMFRYADKIKLTCLVASNLLRYFNSCTNWTVSWKCTWIAEILDFSDAIV